MVKLILEAELEATAEGVTRLNESTALDEIIPLDEAAALGDAESLRATELEEVATLEEVKAVEVVSLEGDPVVVKIPEGVLGPALAVDSI